MSSDEPKEKWYYDACTLDSRLSTYGEMINAPHQSYTSHLAIGEACGNFLNKYDNFEFLETFIDLLKKLKETGKLKIVNNDGVETILQQIRELVPRMSITDSIHAATAIREKCCILRTIDSDFDDFTKPVCKKLANDNGMSIFAVSPMSAKYKEELFHVKKAYSRKK
jgi:predicted nucleic acid-binding protein